MDNYRRNRYCSCLRCMSWNLFGAAIIITVGLLQLFENLGAFGWDRSWPVLLIVIGGLLFARNGAPTDGHIQPMPRGTPPATPPSDLSTYSSTSQANSSSEANHG
jgi:hypothetical protein